MKDLSVGADLALRIAAIEAGAVKFQFIEVEQSSKTVLLLYILYRNP